MVWFGSLFILIFFCLLFMCSVLVRIGCWFGWFDWASWFILLVLGLMAGLLLIVLLI